MRSRTLSALAGAMLALTLAVAPTTALAEEVSLETEVIEEASEGIVSDEETALEEQVIASEATETAVGELGGEEETTTAVNGDGDDEAPSAEGSGASVEVGEEQDAGGDATVTPEEGEATDEVATTVNEETAEEAVATTDVAEEATEEEAAATTTEEGAAEEVTTEASATEELSTQSDPASAAQQALDNLAKAHANDLPSGVYAITSNANPKTTGDKTTYSLDVSGGSTKAGTMIIVYRAKVADNQRWDVNVLSSGYATIKSIASGLYLTLSNGANAYNNGWPTIVQQEYQSGAAWQHWIIAKQSDGTFKIVSGLLKDGTTQCVFDISGGTAANKTNVIAYKNKNTSNDKNQRFTFSVTSDILDAEAKEHRNDLSSGTYLFVSDLKNTYKMNNARGSMDNGTAIILYAGTTAINEGWDIVVNKTTGYATIVNSKSGKALDVKSGTAKDGTQVIQWTKKSGAARNQMWIPERESDGSYKFVSALAGNVRLVLSVQSGKASYSNINIKTDKGSSAGDQHWNLEQAPEQYAYARALSNGTYMIRTALDMTKVLDVSGASKADNAQVKLWTAKCANNQYWIVTHDNQGYVVLKNKNSGKYLSFASTMSGGYYNTVQSSTPKRWIAIPTSNGNFILKDNESNRVIDVCKSQTANGSRTIRYVQKGGTNQQWVIAKNTIIAIDPGHGANDSGATNGAYEECDFTWAIAQACAKKLRSYGFEVYMTVSESEFKNTSLSTPTIKTRVERASKAGAKAIFSMHINAANGSARGAEVLVPNSSSYHKEFYTMGQQFTNDLLPRIKSATGLANRGALVRNYSVADGATENSYYSGGGYADYYGIVRYARLKGMFGVIIEHGFIDNYSDLQIIKSSTTKLGEIDALAIKNLYG